MFRASIGWALTKDRPSLESVPARDDDLFMFQPDSKSTLVGWDQFAKQFDSWMDPRFKTTTFDIRDLRVNISCSGDVAWWSCIPDDQMRFSFAEDAVRAEAAANPYLGSSATGETRYVPFKLSRNKVMVPTRVNGSRPLNLILDTGVRFDGASSRAPAEVRSKQQGADGILGNEENHKKKTADRLFDAHASSRSAIGGVLRVIVRVSAPVDETQRD